MERASSEPTARRLAAGALVLAGAILLAVPALHLATRIRSQHVAVPAALPPSTTEPPRALVPGEVWGRMELPRVGLDLVVYEGVSASELRQGPGHVPGTTCAEKPGESGNCVIAGHRDSFFRRLSRARAGDLVRLRAADGSVSTWRLDSRRVVPPDEVSVLMPSADRRLTLITCYPFSWIGAAPQRLVWSAAPVDRER